MGYEFGRTLFVTREMREKRIAQMDAQKLLHELPSEIADDVEHAFLNYEFDGESANKIRNYFAQNSKISADIVRSAGAPEAFHYLYLDDESAKKEIDNPIDWFFWNCPAGIGIRERLQVMQEQIPAILKQNFFIEEKILIDNLGSGQGYDLIQVIHDNPELANRCHIRNIDIDQEALDRGWERIVQYGLQNTFENVCADFMKVSKRDAHLVVLSGIFCPTALALAKKGLKKLFCKFLRPSGIVLYNATTLRMLDEDTLCDFLMYLAPWKMDYKSIDDILSIAEYANMRIMYTFSDPHMYNCCVVARKKK